MEIRICKLRQLNNQNLVILQAYISLKPYIMYMSILFTTSLMFHRDVVADLLIHALLIDVLLIYDFPNVPLY